MGGELTLHGSVKSDESVEAVFDFQNRTARGFFNGAPMGEIPFMSGIETVITHIGMSLGSSDPIPDVIVYVDDLSLTAGGGGRCRYTLKKS